MPGDIAAVASFLCKLLANKLDLGCSNDYQERVLLAWQQLVKRIAAIGIKDMNPPCSLTLVFPPTCHPPLALRRVNVSGRARPEPTICDPLPSWYACTRRVEEVNHRVAVVRRKITRPQRAVDGQCCGAS